MGIEMRALILRDTNPLVVFVTWPNSMFLALRLVGPIDHPAPKILLRPVQLQSIPVDSLPNEGIQAIPPGRDGFAVQNPGCAKKGPRACQTVLGSCIRLSPQLAQTNWQVCRLAWSAGMDDHLVRTEFRLHQFAQRGVVVNVVPPKEETTFRGFGGAFSRFPCKEVDLDLQLSSKRTEFGPPP